MTVVNMKITIHGTNRQTTAKISSHFYENPSTLQIQNNIEKIFKISPRNVDSKNLPGLQVGCRPVRYCELIGFHAVQP